MRAAVVSGFFFAGLSALGLLQACGSSARRSSAYEDSPKTSTNPTEDEDGGSSSGSGGFGNVDGGDIPDGSTITCSNTNVQFALAPVFLQFVVDRSGSMVGAKWTGLQGALKEVFLQVYNDVDQSTGIGLELFPNSGSGNTYPEAGKDVFIGFVDSAQLSKLNTRVSESTTGATPTYPAMEGGYKVLRNLVPLPPLPDMGKKVQVVMTDGDPSDGRFTDGESGTTPPTRHDHATLAKEQFDKYGIITYVVGIGSGSDVNPRFLGPLAVAGGSADLTTCNPLETTDIAKMCHYQITPGSKTASELKDEFILAIARIRRQAAGCEYALQQDLSADPDRVNVTITVTDPRGNPTQSEISKDPAEGWSFDNDVVPTKIYLHGGACEKATKELNVKVEVLFGCRTKQG